MENKLNTYQLRKHHPAWQLLASTKGPLVIGILQRLFKENPNGIIFDDAVIELAEALREHKDSSDSEQYDELNADDEIEIKNNDNAEARREIRQWIKRKLLLEREGRIIATDALESALRFVKGLDQRIMSSSASRLAIVQREIELLETSLNPDPRQRADYLKNKIAELEAELTQVEQGHIEVHSEELAIESIQEVFLLSTSLSHDFRRVEDSYRKADQQLRQSIIAEQNNRGEVVDKLLDTHDQLLNTMEGKVFNGFFQQLNRKLELDKMKVQLKSICKHPSAKKALSLSQESDLKWLIMNLVKESGAVVKARARSEKDVRGFLKTGLAAEHHRVGHLLNDIFAEAFHVNWQSQKTRRAASPLPPLGQHHSGLPSIERLLFKEWQSNSQDELNLLPQKNSVNDLDDDFWDGFDGLDQIALINQTKQLLLESDKSMSISQLAKHLPPSHDLETIALWLSMAMATDTVISGEDEKVDLKLPNHKMLRFTLPKIALSSKAVLNVEFDT